MNPNKIESKKYELILYPKIKNYGDDIKNIHKISTEEFIINPLEYKNDYWLYEIFLTIKGERYDMDKKNYVPFIYTSLYKRERLCEMLI